VPRTAGENARLKEIGANICRQRVSAGLTQEKLAEEINLNVRNLQKIEAGETNLLVTTFFRVCIALRCSADELLPKK
jgi:transcriptional regulator with XRE-family HTH domain